MPKQVLIAEDDRALCRSLARAVEKLGYGVQQVHDGDAALESVRDHPPDLVLLDLLLPKVDGLGVVRRLRSVEMTEIPLVAMSGVYRGASVARDLERAGVDVFLEKPFSARDLAGHLERLLGPAQVAAAEKEESERYDLAITPAPQVLWPPMRDGLTGVLHFQLGKRHKELLLENGRPRAVRSNLVKETLGRRLFDAGHIDQRAYQEAQRRGQATGQPQGAVLVKLGAISQAQVDRALVAQARDKLFDLLAWTEGEAWFAPSARAVSQGTELEGWTPRKAIVQGAGSIHSAVIQRGLQPFHDCEVAVDTNVVQGEELGPAAQALLGILRSEKRVGALLRDHAATLYAMWLVGAVSFQGAAQSGVASGPADRGGPGLAKQLEELKRAHRSQNHFEVLGLETSATGADAHRAFVGLAKQHHPDKVGAESPELQALASEVFARISEANEVISDSERRRNYLKQLKKGSSAEADQQAVTRIVSAEQQFRKAEELVKRRQYSQAIEALQWALRLDPAEGEFHALLGWASFLANPHDISARDEAVENMKKATTLAPNSPSGYYFLGKLYKASEQLEAAEKMFRKVLELRPGHVEATQELRLFELRRSKSGNGTKTRFGLGRTK
ncbi:MAG: response regulator [Myxococcota bacterium]